MHPGPQRPRTRYYSSAPLHLISLTTVGLQGDEISSTQPHLLFPLLLLLCYCASSRAYFIFSSRAQLYPNRKV
ncbi:hypothetical protein BDQ17DRAFT_1363600 [Cyathus striatus]|nr:hypothetical protein BDQ17DRAFT_1363600 [Cyathus striatus]